MLENHTLIIEWVPEKLKCFKCCLLSFSGVLSFCYSDLNENSFNLLIFLFLLVFLVSDVFCITFLLQFFVVVFFIYYN